MLSAKHEQIAPLSDLPVLFKYAEIDGEYIANHWHEDLEIIYLLHGHMEVHKKEQCIHLYDHDFIIINSGEIHSTSTPMPSSLYLLQIPAAFLEKCITGYPAVIFDNPAFSGKTGERGNNLSKRLRDDLYMMGSLYQQHQDGYALGFQAALFHFLFLLDTSAKVIISPLERSKSEKNKEQLSKITRYVASHYTETISLKTAANIVNLQPEYFCRFFKHYMGMTFINYVNEVRFSHVYDDIIKTDYSIHAILEKHGFHNYKLFMQLFREKYKCTPTMKRKSILP